MNEVQTQRLFADSDHERRSQRNVQLFLTQCRLVANVVDALYGTFTRTAKADKLSRLFELAVTSKKYGTPLGEVVRMHRAMAVTYRGKQLSKTNMGCTIERLTDPHITAAVRRKLSHHSATLPMASNPKLSGSLLDMARNVVADPSGYRSLLR